jgi:hypothetical protein
MSPMRKFLLLRSSLFMVACLLVIVVRAFA